MIREFFSYSLMIPFTGETDCWVLNFITVVIYCNICSNSLLASSFLNADIKFINLQVTSLQPAYTYISQSLCSVQLDVSGFVYSFSVTKEYPGL